MKTRYKTHNIKTINVVTTTVQVLSYRNADNDQPLYDDNARTD